MERIRNFTLNIKPIMVKIKNKDKVSQDELNIILEYWLEIVSILSTKN